MSRHARPDGATRFPVGMVYVGYWTRNVYRMRPKGERTIPLLIRDRPWLPGQHRHRAPEQAPDPAVRTDTCEYLGQGFCAASVDGYCVGGWGEGRCHG